MIPSGKAHNEMLLPDEATDEAVAYLDGIVRTVTRKYSPSSSISGSS